MKFKNVKAYRVYNNVGGNQIPALIGLYPSLDAAQKEVKIAAMKRRHRFVNRMSKNENISIPGKELTLDFWMGTFTIDPKPMVVRGSNVHIQAQASNAVSLATQVFTRGRKKSPSWWGRVGVWSGLRG